jgi:hypothetical protein
MANPSMGWTDLTERAIADAAATDPDEVFFPEVLCRFVNHASVGPFPNGSWAAIREAKVVRDVDRGAAYCVSVSANRTMAYIAIAFWDVDGRRRVEIAAQRPGTDWIIPWLRSSDRILSPADGIPVTLQTNGAAVSSLVDDFENAGIDLVDWAGPDLARAHGMFFDVVRRSPDDEDAPILLTHGDQPSLDIAANTARIKPLGGAGGWVVDLVASPEDAAPLVAAIGAHWLLATVPVQRQSAYEDHDLMVV